MGAYRVKGLQLSEVEEKIPVYEDFFKFANFAKEYVQKNIVHQQIKWKGPISSTHDITHKGIEYKGVTFIVEPLYFRTK